MRNRPEHNKSKFVATRRSARMCRACDVDARILAEYAPSLCVPRRIWWFAVYQRPAGAGRGSLGDGAAAGPAWENHIMDNKKLTRRSFLAGTAAMTIAAGCTTTKGKAPAKVSVKSPSEMVNFAGIGCGGKGSSDVQGALDAGCNLVAMCDVDEKNAAKFYSTKAGVPTYRDYRVMLDKHKDIDAVNVSTPDHMHAMIAIHAMKMGKHVYVQKPLAHSIHECREMQRVANEMKVATQMGNQGHCGDGVREVCELIWAGAIGDVKKVVTWTNRPIWPQSIPEPLPEEPVPETLDWDLWLGGAPFREYNHGYCPFNWRGWWDFGCGALGDMACHIMDPANWALTLGVPTSVEVAMQEGNNAQTGPDKSILKYEFPERKGEHGKMFPAVTLEWWDGRDGNNTPPHPPEIPAEIGIGDKGSGKNGTLFYGSKGFLTCETYGGSPRLLPEADFASYKKPEPSIPRLEKGDPYIDWVKSIKSGKPSASNFNYAAPFTEIILLGNLALRASTNIQWDIQNMRVTNSEEANKLVTKQYREGWSL